MSEPVKAESRRDEMPATARWVDARRTEWGKAYVNACLRRAMAGEPGEFYAMENGLFLGTPFPAGSEMSAWQDYAVATGCKFAAFMRRPKESELGAD